MKHIFLFTLTLFLVSCGEDAALDNMAVEAPSTEAHITQAETMADLHQQAIATIHREIEPTTDQVRRMKEALHEARQTIDQDGMVTFRAQYDMEKATKAAEFYLESPADDNIYQLMVENFELSEEDASKAFQIVEITRALSTITNEKRDLGCALAIGSYIAGAAGAATIGGPVGLGVWAVGMGFNTAGVIYSCS